MISNKIIVLFLVVVQVWLFLRYYTERNTDVLSPCPTHITTAETPVHKEPKIGLVMLAFGMSPVSTLPTIQSARDIGQFQGDILVLHDSDDQRHDAMLRCVGVIPVRAEGAEELMSLVPLKVHKRSQHTKVLIFLMDIFRQYDLLLYFDSDILFLRALQPLIDMYRGEGDTCKIAIRANINKKGLYDEEFVHRYPDPRRYPDRNPPAATCIMVWQPSRLLPRDRLLNETKQLLAAYAPFFKHNDQGLLNLLFYHDICLLDAYISVYNPASGDLYAQPEKHIVLHSLGERSPHLKTSPYHAYARYFIHRMAIDKNCDIEI